MASVLTCVKQQPRNLILEGVQPHALYPRRDCFLVLVAHMVLWVELVHLVHVHLEEEEEEGHQAVLRVQAVVEVLSHHLQAGVG